MTAERLFVPLMKGGLILQVAILPAQAYVQLAKLDAEIRNARPPMSEGEISLRRAEIATSFAWGAFTTTVSAAQMMGMPTMFGHETPGTGTSDTGVPGEHLPTDGAGQSDHPAPEPNVPHDTPPARARAGPGCGRANV